MLQRAHVLALFDLAGQLLYQLNNGQDDLQEKVTSFCLWDHIEQVIEIPTSLAEDPEVG